MIPDRSYRCMPIRALLLSPRPTRRCSGDVAECGVYKGGSAKILAELVPDRPLHCSIPSRGCRETDPTRDLHKAGDFADTTCVVREYLSITRTQIACRGWSRIHSKSSGTALFLSCISISIFIRRLNRLANFFIPECKRAVCCYSMTMDIPVVLGLGRRWMSFSRTNPKCRCNRDWAMFRAKAFRCRLDRSGVFRVALGLASARRGLNPAKHLFCVTCSGESGRAGE